MTIKNKWPRLIFSIVIGTAASCMGAPTWGVLLVIIAWDTHFMVSEKYDRGY